METKYILVDDAAALNEICRKFEGSSWLAVDTEFEREKTYYPELCLLQLANEHLTAVVDPFAIDDLKPLHDLLYDTSVTKVFHAARQDLEIFYHMWGAVPQPLFDTQLAAPLIGCDEQIGYGNLVNKMLGVNLGKAHTRTDWKRRPLTQAQLEYAADDVIYLGQLYRLLLSELEKNNRIAWLEEDFRALCSGDLYRPDADMIWKRHKGAKKLRGKKLCALQHLAAWRERLARTENRPRNWLVRDETLLDLAGLLPSSLSDLGRIKGLNERVIRKYGEDIVRVVSESAALEALPQHLPAARKPLNNQEEAIVDALSTLVKLIADANSLHPNILASRKELEKFVRDDAGSLLLKGWREHLVGRELRAFLAGGISLQIDNGKITYKQV